MKHINIIWLLFLFIFLHDTLSAQSTTAAVDLVSKGKTSPKEFTQLPIVNSLIKSDAILPLPIYKLPESFDKKYLIRVHQSDTAIFQKFIKDLPIGLKYHRGFDHKGYDYFLPVAFNKEADAQHFLAKLSGPISNKALVVKNRPKKAKCNCFSRF